LKLLNPIDRSGQVPRSVLILSILLLVSASALFLLNRRSSSSDLVLGGSLFELENTTIDGFLLTRDGGQYRFQKNDAGYWTLRGGVVDYLDQDAVSAFLRDLGLGEGGRIMAGTEIEDRRYDFNGPQSMRLTVFTTDGRQQKLSVGASNPVTGFYYASGVGRPGCFPVTEIFRNRLAALPASLQSPQLLPKFDRHLITRVELFYGAEHHVLQKFDGRWWLKQPETGLGSWGEEARAYHQFYSDRVIVKDEETWLLASRSRVHQVIYESSEIIINDTPDPRMAQARLQEFELDPPWRQVKLHGTGINPDFTESSADVLEIALGMALEDKRVPVLRRGNVLMTEGEALTMLSGSLTNFLDVGAVSFLVADCDSLWGRREGKTLLHAVRGEEPIVQPGLQRRPAVESWLTVYPTRSQRPKLGETSHNGISRNLIINLDRLEILKVLPPTDDARVLLDTERVVFEIHNGDSMVNLEFGFLNEDLISDDLITPPDGLRPVGLWRPDTGQLLQVPGHPVVTMRSLNNSLKKK